MTHTKEEAGNGREREITPWQERTETRSMSLPLFEAMKAEIAELRAALASQQPAGAAGASDWKVCAATLIAEFEAIPVSGVSLKYVQHTLAGRMAELLREIVAAPAPHTGASVPEADEEREMAEWEARKAELRGKYPDIAGDYKVFEVLITTERGCKVDQGEYRFDISRLICGTVGEDDYQIIAEAIAEEIGNLKLPDEGQTPVIVYESGERQDVFWTKFYRVAAPAISVTEEKKGGE